MKRIIILVVYLMVLTCSNAYAEKVQYESAVFGIKGTLPEGWKIFDSRTVEIKPENFQMLRLVAASNDRLKIACIVATEKEKQNGDELSEDNVNRTVNSTVNGYKSSRPQAQIIGSQVKTVGGHKGIWINIADDIEKNKQGDTRFFVFPVKNIDYSICLIAKNTSLDEAEIILNDLINNMAFVF